MTNQQTSDGVLTAARAIVVGLMFAYTAIGGAAVASVSDAVLVGLGLICLAAVTLPLFFRRNYHLLEPATPVAALVGVCVNVKLLYILWFRHSSDNVDERLLIGQGTDALMFGTTVVAVALLVFSLGYLVTVRVPMKRIFLPRHANWNRKRVLIVLVLMLGVAALFFVLFVKGAGVNFSSPDQLSQKRFGSKGTGSAGRLHSLVYYFYRLAALSKLVFIITLGWILKTKRSLLSPEGGILALSGAMAVLLCIVVSNRAGVVLVLLDAAVIWFLITRRVSFTKLAIFGAGVFAAIVFLLYIRGGSNQTMRELVEQTLAGRDLMDISKTCHIINAVPETIDYRYGETLIGWVAAPIPKSMWPGKPLWAERGVYLSRYIYGDRWGFTGIPPGLIAEFYWNLGWFGVVPGMFLFGMLWRMFFENYQANETNLNAVIVYTLVINRALLFTFGLDFGSGILKAAMDVVPFLVVVMLVSRATNPRSVTARPSRQLVNAS